MPGWLKYVLLFTDAELNFDGSMASWPFLRACVWEYWPWILSALYLLSLPLLRHVMMRRGPLRSQTLLAAWNLGLSIFSGIGSIRVIPQGGLWGFAFIIAAENRRDSKVFHPPLI